MFWTLVMLLFAALLVAVLPRWRYSRRWGYGPSAMAGVLLLSIALLLLLARF